MPQKEESEFGNSNQDCSCSIRLVRDQKEREQALSLMISETDPEVKRQEVEKVLKLHQESDLNLNKMLIGLQAGEIRAALLMVIQEDQTAILWPPVCDLAVNDSDSLENFQNLLIQKACFLAKEVFCDVIQATVDCNDLQTSELFSKNGLPSVGTLLFLQRPAVKQVGEEKKEICDNDHSVLVPVVKQISDDELGDLVLETYVGSADFPELQLYRSGDRALHTHRLQGEYNPEHWFVIEDEGIRVGVLFFSYHGEFNQWELTYLGIIPEHRGKGIARRVILKSFEHPLRKNCGLFLGVDARNTYAISLYESLGFVVVARQLVHAWHQQLNK